MEGIPQVPGQGVNPQVMLAGMAQATPQPNPETAMREIQNSFIEADMMIKRLADQFPAFQPGSEQIHQILTDGLNETLYQLTSPQAAPPQV